MQVLRQVSRDVVLHVEEDPDGPGLPEAVDECVNLFIQRHHMGLELENVNGMHLRVRVRVRIRVRVRDAMVFWIRD